MEFPATQNWADNHHPLLARSIALLPLISETSYQLLTDKSLKISFETGTIPDIKEWLSLYQDGEHTKLFIFNILKSYKNLIKLVIMGDPHKNSLPLIAAETTSIPLGEHDRTLFDTPVMKFGCYILMPALFHFGSDPFQLFQKAQNGDLESIRRLFSLDPSVLGDPKIFRHFHEASKNKDRKDYILMASALNKSQNRNFSFPKVKFRVAGLISGVSESFGFKLTAPDIEKLFDAIASDYDKPDWKLVDAPDINNESIYKRIQREKELFSDILNPDKK